MSAQERDRENGTGGSAGQTAQELMLEAPLGHPSAGSTLTKASPDSRALPPFFLASPVQAPVLEELSPPAMAAGAPGSGWKKLLYINQEYPDNYVDATFLEEMQKNVNVRAYKYWDVVLESGAITQHISSIVVFVAVFINLYSNSLSARNLITIGTILTTVGFAAWDASLQKIDETYTSKRRRIFKGAILFFTTLLGMSPILKTLTKDTSSDTIWAMTVILFVANTAFHDYGKRSRTSAGFPNSLSINAAIFASVLLASRLSSNLHVFGLLSFAVECFALFPIFSKYFRNLSVKYDIAVTVVLALLTVGLFSYISRAVVIIYVTGILFVTFVCPLWLIWIQRYKNEIHGPWDEAKIIIRG